jgi:hypothetical protein
MPRGPKDEEQPADVIGTAVIFFLEPALIGLFSYLFRRSPSIVFGPMAIGPGCIA